MGLAYVPPGVYVSELITPSINPLLAAPANVCIVGPAQGFVQQTDYVTLTNTDAVRLPNLPLNATLVQPLVSVNNINSVGSPYVENTDYVVNYVTNVNEVQTVTLAGATGGTFTLKFRDETTTALAWNISAANLEAALEVLGGLDPADVAVTGSAGGPYTITFGGQFANENVDQLVADGTLLTGSSPTVTVATPTQGGVTGTVARVSSGAISQGETVIVVYKYLPSNYYAPTRLSDQSSVEALYGSAFNSTGGINSLVSFAAGCAFENGATDVVIQALFRRATDNDPNSARQAPTALQVQDSLTWEQTLYPLRDIEDVNVLVPAIGQAYPGLIDSELQSIFQKFQDHVKFMADQQQYVFAIFGEDSSLSTTVGQASIIRAHLTALQSRYGGAVNSQIIMLNSAKFGRVNPQTSQPFFVGGQYAAAAIAGMLAARPVSSSLTRQTISGFTSIADTPPRSKADKNADAAAGLVVLTEKDGTVQIRHSITTDTTATARREVSVVRAKHRMVESVRDTLESQVIGQVIADGNAPSVVAVAVQGVLETLKTIGDLVDYKDIQARTLTLDPTTVEVRYSYKPSFPLNYINIAFSIDLTTDGGVVTI